MFFCIRQASRPFYWLLFSLLALLLLSCPVSGAQTTELSVQMTYGQFEARTLLGLLNGFRDSEDAWVYTPDGNDQIHFDNLPRLHYDYELERAAMIRAAEIAFYFSHTRPNGGSCFSVADSFSDENIYGTSAGENIGTGYPTAAEVFLAWQETEEGYEGQAHRRCMLSPDYTAVGIGHVVYRGTHYWACQFGNRPASETRPVPSVNGLGPVTLTVPDSWITSLKVTARGEKRAFILQHGERITLPALTGQVTLGENHTFDLYPRAEWESPDETIITTVHRMAYAHHAGKVFLSATASGQTLTLALTVRPKDIGTFTIEPLPGPTLAPSRTPSVQVTDGETTLVEGQDYTLTVSPSEREGYLDLVATGKGDYTGTLQATLKRP